MKTALLNPVTNFVLQALYESFRNACAVAVVAIGGDQVSLFTIDWHTLAGVSGGAFIVTLLTCLGAQPFGDKASTSPIPGVLHAVYNFLPVTTTPATVTADPASVPVSGGAHVATPTMGAATNDSQ